MYGFLLLSSLIQLATAIINSLRTAAGIIVVLIIGRFGYLLYLHDMNFDMAFDGVMYNITSSYDWLKLKWISFRHEFKSWFV